MHARQTHMSDYLDAPALLTIALAAQSHAAAPCNCTRTPLDGWNSQPVSLDEERLQEVGTLCVASDPEPSYQEYLPQASITGHQKHLSHRDTFHTTAAPYGSARNAPGSIFDTRKAAVILSTAGSVRCVPLSFRTFPFRRSRSGYCPAEDSLVSTARFAPLARAFRSGRPEVRLTASGMSENVLYSSASGLA